ncbi:MAG: 1-phosphofructokinase family hexose kinase [Synergistaceae bacterium]|jgi:1-phosphofructokinase|nr:1-phosphofructokinase family hexose kinase [Synergistaceae bacterium]
MISTVTLNPCTDLTVTVDDLKIEATNHIVGTRRDIGGKGINVSVALHQMGYPTKCLGIRFRQDGDSLTSALGLLGIPFDFVQEDGSMRTNIKIFNRKKRAMTELNEMGGSVSMKTLDLVTRKICESAAESTILVLAGSVPRGVPRTVYHDIVQKLNGSGVKVIADVRGDLLANVLCGGVFLIKPNIGELEEAVGRPIHSFAELIREARNINNLGVRYVCVSMGIHGAAIIGGHECWYASAPDVEVRGLQGAGDSMVAGMCIAMEKNLTAKEMLRYGTAVCGGSLMREGTLMCTREGLDYMLARVHPVSVSGDFELPLM